jgi:hypothetical protein
MVVSFGSWEMLIWALLENSVKYGWIDYAFGYNK